MPNPREDVLDWAMAIVQKEMETGAFGRVTIIIEAGQIVRTQVERSEKPPPKQTSPRLQSGGFSG